MKSFFENVLAPIIGGSLGIVGCLIQLVISAISTFIMFYLGWLILSWIF